MSYINQNNDYSAKSIADATDNPVLLSAGANYRAVTQSIHSANGVMRGAYTGTKLLLNEAGALVSTGVRGYVETKIKSTAIYQAAADGIRGWLSRNPTTTTYKAYNAVNEIDRTDMSLDYVFRCGDYYLPLSMTYSVMSEKEEKLSQLVDGPEIVQALNIKPSVIEVNIRLEQAPRDRRQTRNMSFVSSSDALAASTARLQSEISGILGEESANESIEQPSPADFGAVLRNLYKENDVFEIENNTINKVFGITYVYIKSFDYSTNQGSSIVNIRMTLREINMAENIIAIPITDIDTSTTAAAGNSEYLDVGRAGITIGQITVDNFQPGDLNSETQADRQALRDLANKQVMEQGKSMTKWSDFDYIKPSSEQAIESSEKSIDLAEFLGDIGTEVYEISNGNPAPELYVSPYTGEYAKISDIIQQTIAAVQAKKDGGEF